MIGRLQKMIEASLRIDRAAFAVAAASVRALGALLRGCLQALWLAALFVLPQLVKATWANRLVTKNFTPSVGSKEIAANGCLDKDAAIALWESETERFNGLASKATGVLAADALVAAGLATQGNPKGPGLYLTIACLVYLVSAATAACWIQTPMAREAVFAADVLDGSAASRMVEVVVTNEAFGTKLNNLVYAGVRDTLWSLVLLALVMVTHLLS